MNLTNEKYDALIKSYLEGQCSQDESLVLLSWIAESEENRNYFEAFKDVWTLTDFSLDEEDIDVEAALESVNEKIEAAETETKTVEMPWLRRNYKYVSVAAAIMVALFLGFLISMPFGQTVTVAYDDTQPEQVYQLPDGSSFIFNGTGEVSYSKRFANNSRDVKFEGKAFFDVAKDASHPFVIHCDGLDVEVLGTTFLLDASNERYTVDLYSGLVRMTAVDKHGHELSHLDIKPGERGVWDVENGGLKMMTYAEVKEEELKTDHVLDFNNVSLNTIIETVEYIYSIEVKLPETYASEKVTMRFSDEDSVDDVVETIATLFGLEVSKTDKTYTIY
ncbi:MAG: FecR domain-containing protein [Bacteroidales bacterium]|nr:FecR domain-containing protein [Bacteroidales bacterium]